MDTKSQDRSKQFTRRAFLVGALQCTFLTGLGVRLAWLQLAQGERYTTLADNNRINLKILSPSRGQILDRNAVPLAMNDQNFRVIIIPEQTDDLGKALSRLQKLIELSQTDIKKVVSTADRQATFVPIEVKDNLSWEDVATIEVNLTDLPGLYIDVGEIRTYPQKEAAAHIVGYVGAVNRSELTGDPVLALPGFRIGKTGLEKTFDDALRGQAGSAEVEVNVVGREVRELKRNAGSIGKTLHLSIDIGLQEYVQERLSTEKSATAIIMDVQTGAVYALCSSPSFDPNMFTHGLSAEAWEDMLANPGLPLNNKAVGGQYPPGSTFKMITAMAGLEDKIVTRNNHFYCSGYYEYGSDRFHCWKRGGHGQMAVVDALRESCDTYFYEIATKVGIDRIAHYARMFGLGDKLGFELTEERPGLVPDQAWKRGHYGTAWQPGETIVASIGQGYIQATPLQMSVMTARLVNGGYAVKPWMTLEGQKKFGIDVKWPKIAVQTSNLALVREGMEQVVNNRKGTAHAAAIHKEGFEMAGKTGTAQVRRISMADRLEGVQNEDLAWKYRHHALFVGYAPYKNPRYVCTVVVEHGGSGSATAAPIARDLLLKVQELDVASRDIKLEAE